MPLGQLGLLRSYDGSDCGDPEVDDLHLVALARMAERSPVRVVEEHLQRRRSHARGYRHREGVFLPGVPQVERADERHPIVADALGRERLAPLALERPESLFEPRVVEPARRTHDRP